ncbi:hypothetical protein SAMD00019534_120360 [Acytostelium subglobosum LB1]|uniref:hypothetical protein n=1 Tax=Acytostelium subglobosum LB1 TaxID=1410327 RepID=UPI000644AD2F|nr:hypothetical protein SAMD00019534_120360 [Acytostelium subglobosum LB1]GAM28860.1 hypothetical protein SAMD00019534_120360 [Acytostelium subglobosum LB1]|eukprot:XP_012748232.1 hypothetical protein SAMD00019534_120360 [Acytostelium subglobosum LB1]
MYGYDVQSHLTYFMLLDELYLSKDPRWTPVNAQTAPVGDTLQQTIKLSRASTSATDIPLLLTNLTLEFNSPTTYIRLRNINNNNNNELEGDITSPNNNEVETTEKEEEEKHLLRSIPSGSIIRNAISGYQLMIDKFNLTRNLAKSKYLVPTMLIERGRITQSFQVDHFQQETAMVTSRESVPIVWFLKDPLKNRGEGIELFHSVDESLKHCLPNKRYILQREIIPMLFNSFKFDVRINIALVFNSDETKLYIYNEGIMRCTGTKYVSGSVEKGEQFTNFCFQQKLNPSFGNIVPLADWDTDGSRLATMEQAVGEIFDLFLPRLNQLRHSGVTVFGLDFIFDSDGHPYLLEINNSPSMFVHSNERVASICRRAIAQLPALAFEPLLEGATPIAKDWKLLRDYTNRHRCTNTDSNDDGQSEDFNLFDDL